MYVYIMDVIKDEITSAFEARTRASARLETKADEGVFGAKNFL